LTSSTLLWYHNIRRCDVGKTVLVCGDRNWTDHESVLRELRALQAEGYTKVIEGGAKGADTISNRVARFLGMETLTVEANWMMFGKAAGPIRNSEMLKMKPDFVLAFHPDLTKSKGTIDTVTKARAKKIPVKVVSE
jgi:hypothetical protein